MIACTPINKVIRDKLENKKKILGREIRDAGSTVSDINEDGTFLKTTFIRMTSNLENQITLMGGELKEDGTLYAGYEEKYGARRGLDNKFKRPIPGVKSITVNYEGGLKARRKAQVSWTCWSLEDLEELRKHFLSTGKSILLEWGFSKKGQIFTTPFDENGKIIQSIFTDNIQRYNIINNGDYDLLPGYISNFEWRTREDGAFDCTTDIVGLGVNMTDSYVPSSDVEFSTEIKSTGFFWWKGEKEVITEGQEDELYQYNAAISMGAVAKSLKKNIQKYQIGLKPEGFRRLKEVMEFIRNTGLKQSGLVPLKNFSKSGKGVLIYKNGTITFYRVGRRTGGAGRTAGSFTLEPDICYVTWGWFEDNFLNKFISLANDNEAVTTFRSIEPVLLNDGTGYETNDDGSIKYENVRIKSNPALRTTDFNKFVFPGLTPINKAGKKFNAIARFINRLELPAFQDELDNKKGYLRNILINVDEIVDIFANKQPNSVKSVIENLMGSLNEDIPLWDLTIQVDSENQSLLKIVDNKFVYKKPSKFIEEENEQSQSDLFVFPVWRHNSFIKTQNLSSRVPSQMQLATMYGSNVQVTRSQGTPPSNIDKKGYYVGLLSNDLDIKDEKLSNLEFPFRKGTSGDTSWRTFGNESADPNQPLTKDGGIDFYTTVKDEIQQLIGDEVSSRIQKQRKTTKREDSLKASADVAGITVDQLQSIMAIDNNDNTTIYDKNGVMEDKYLKGLRDSILGKGNSAVADEDPLIPIDLDLTIEGVSGIYPGNAFHTAYLPKRYRDLVVFQTFEVGHTVDSSQWNVDIKGVMRLSAENKYGDENKDVVVEEKEKPIPPEIVTTAKPQEQYEVKMNVDGDLGEISVPYTTTAIDNSASGINISVLDKFNKGDSAALTKEQAKPIDVKDIFK